MSRLFDRKNKHIHEYEATFEFGASKKPIMVFKSRYDYGDRMISVQDSKLFS